MASSLLTHLMLRLAKHKVLENFSLMEQHYLLGSENSAAATSSSNSLHMTCSHLSGDVVKSSSPLKMHKVPPAHASRGRVPLPSSLTRSAWSQPRWERANSSLRCSFRKRPPPWVTVGPTSSCPEEVAQGGRSSGLELLALAWLR